MSAPKKFDPETAENLEDIEKQFAVKAVLHAQTYWRLLETNDPSSLRLTPYDDEIYDHLVKDFPEFEKEPSKAEVVDEDEMKSHHNKPRWRSFMNEYEKKIDDFNFGTLLRTSAQGEYEEKNTIFVPRMQFYAIEIFRNRHGMNDWITQASTQ
ncbi:hypothetical protein TRVA0_008S01816 [Trichomonascus vanleenenianus]|uniref:ribosome-associated Tef1p biogenesis chaperone CHP1 n=1 Tax=Trichomonascus vanleenenianus TaxID=2268995 RepID=UPI003EC9C135